MAGGSHKPAHHRQHSLQQAPPPLSQQQQQQQHTAQQQRRCEVVSRLVSPFAVLLLLACLLAYLALSHARPPPPALVLAADTLPPAAVLQRDSEAAATVRFDAAARVARVAVDGGERDVSGGKREGVDPRQDERGWMLDPIAAAVNAGLKGGATSCLVSHVGQVLPGKVRGNHRHRDYNETLVLWGARMRVRNENRDVPKGYAEVILTADDVAVMAGPAMSAHAVINIDTSRPAYLMACQDGMYDASNPCTDYGVWTDLA